MSIVADCAAALQTIKNCFEFILAARKQGGFQQDAPILELMNRLQTAEEQLLTLRQAATNLVKENRRLDQELAEVKHFRADRKSYIRVTLSTGTTVYTFKERPGESPVYFCAERWDQCQHKILQPDPEDARGRTYRCSGCGHKFLMPYLGKYEVISAGRSVNFDGYV